MLARLASTVGATPVTAMSTDVPFRQTATKLARARAQADVLDMECATLFQVADYLGIDLMSFVVISDHYDEATWRPGNPTVVTRELRALVDDVATALAAI